MAIKGEQRADNSSSSKVIGFLKVDAVGALSPTKSELNKLFSKEDSEEDKDIVYLGPDKEGNDRVRLVFWLRSDKFNKYIPYSFNITNKVRTNKAGDKVQYVSSTCDTAWCPIDENGVADESLLVDWFKNFQDKERNNTKPKLYRPALLGEEELATFLKGALGRVTFTKDSTEITWDPQRLLNGDFGEIREMIESSYAAPFVVLAGVRTDPDDDTKEYQSIWGKGFLPGNFMKFIENDFDFKGNEFDQRRWDKFLKGVEDTDYGFSSFYELVPAKTYDPADNIAAGKDDADEAPTNSRY